VKVWQELRRRRVFRVAGLYVVGAWLVIQVADILFPAWGLPETALRYLFIAAAAGFPVALVFGWFYDFTPRGITRTTQTTHTDVVDLSLKRTDFAILMALAAVGLAILLGSLGSIREEIESGQAVTDIERRENSIAVLPFKNLDVNSDIGYFSDGVTEEILHRLSTLGALHVLASTSSFAFRDSDLSPADISGRLGVRYLLMGSVRRDADRVRVTARLLDETGFQLWSDSFDRKLEGIFTIQTEIARIVSSHIVNEIVPMQELPAGRTTESMEAYSAYLGGKAYLDQRTTDWQEKAQAAFRRAIELDPGYAPPYAGLAVAIIIGKGRGPQVEEGRSLAETAVNLDANFAFGHAALGLTQTIGGEFEIGLQSLRRAIELDPSLATGWAWLAYALRMLERHEEADEVDRHGLEIDPLNPILVLNMSESEQYRGNFKRAEALLQRLTTLPKPPVYVFDRLAELYEFRGAYPQAVEAIKEQIRVDPAPSKMLDLASRYARLGMFGEADYWYEQGRGYLPDDVLPMDKSWEYSRYRGERSWLLADLQRLETGRSATDAASGTPYFVRLLSGGFAYIRIGDYTKGIDFLERGIDGAVEVWRQVKPPDDLNAEIEPIGFLWARWYYWTVSELFTHLAFAYREVGREDVASQILEILGGLGWSSDDFERTPVALWPDAFMATHLVQRSLFLALGGDSGGSLEALKEAISLGWSAGEGGYYDLINDPAWATTIANPAFQDLLADAKAELDKQRAVVEAADAAHDFRAEVEAMLAHLE